MMAKLSKRVKELSSLIDRSVTYSASSAFNLLKKSSRIKFKESVDISVQLNVDPRNSEQVIRGTTILPYGTGKLPRVAVFAEGENKHKAIAAGADLVGMDNLVTRIKKRQLDFDVVIATPSSMDVVVQLGEILGPRGLMPNPKLGTVCSNIEKAVKDIKSGRIQFRVDKSGIIHATIGKIDFNVSALQQNLETFLTDLRKLKPTTVKNDFFKKIVVSSTMGPGIVLDMNLIGV